MEAHEVLEQVKSGKMTVEEAEQFFKREPFEEMGYAKIDSHRKMRSGFAEVVFCQGKRDEFLLEIFQRIYKDEGEVMGTRASLAQYELLHKELPPVSYTHLDVYKRQILEGAERAKAAKPDLVEFRVDWYEEAADSKKVVALLEKLRKCLGELPVLFTFRSSREGGEAALSDGAYQSLRCV